MEVGIPGENGERPAPPHGAGHVAKWLLAAISTAPAYLLAQSIAALVLGIALLSTDVGLLTSFATFAGLALAVLWWLHLRPRALLRRDEARPSRPTRVAALACTLLVLGIALQVVLSCALSLVLPLFPQVMDNYLELMELAGIADETSLVTLVEIAVLAPIANFGLIPAGETGPAAALLAAVIAVDVVAAVALVPVLRQARVQALQVPQGQPEQQAPEPVRPLPVRQRPMAPLAATPGRGSSPSPPPSSP